MPLIVRAGFWEEEGGGGNPAEAAPLLRRNAGFICDPLGCDGSPPGVAGRTALEVCRAAAVMNKDVLERARRWVALCDTGGVGGGAARFLEGGASPPVMSALPEGPRILAADAERTFKNEALRGDMVALLTRVADGDYHQV